MSIINEALRKTQQIRKQSKEKRATASENPADNSANSSPEISKESFFQIFHVADRILSHKLINYFIMIALLGIITVISFEHSRNANQTEMITATSSPRERISLAGILVGENSKIAIMNKQAYHPGDTILGMKIVAIHEDAVDLKRKNKIVRLRAGATYLI